MFETGSSEVSESAFTATLAQQLVASRAPCDGLGKALDLVAAWVGVGHVRIYELVGEQAVTLLHRGDGETPSRFPDRIAVSDLTERRTHRTSDGTTYLPLRHDGRISGVLVLGPGTARRDLGHDALALLAAYMLRHHAEQTERVVDLELRRLFDAVEDIVYVLDARTGAGIYINPAYESVTGRPCSDWLTQRTDRDPTVHPEDRAPVQELLARYLTDAAAPGPERSTPCRWESRLVSADGADIWFETKMYPGYDSAGRLTRLYAVAHDIAYRREIESELTALLEEAERERTHQDREIERFVHDLRGPIAALAALAQRSTESYDRPERRRMVEHTSAAADEVAELFEARIVPLLNRHQHSSRPGACRVLEVLEQAATLARRTPDTRQIPRDLGVLADHLQLRRALTVVLEAYDNDVSVAVEQRQGEVLVVLRDADSPWAPVAEAAERAATLLDPAWGTVSVTPDVESVFVLHAALAAIASGTALGGVRDLVVDDHEWTVDVTATVLREAGADVEVQSRAAEMLLRLRNERYDIMVLDRNLPDATADELLPAIRTLAPDLAVLVLTADAFPESRRDVLGAGATGYLSKPFTSATLTHSVLLALDEKRQSAQN